MKVLQRVSELQCNSNIRVDGRMVEWFGGGRVVPGRPTYLD